MRKLLATLLIATSALVACTDDPSPTPQRSADAPPLVDLAEVEVSGDPGQPATLSFDRDFKADSTGVHREISPGEGADIVEGMTLRANVVQYDARGNQTSSSYATAKPVYIPMALNKTYAVFFNGFLGSKVGSRHLVARSEQQSRIASGEPGSSENLDPTSLFVIDILDAHFQKATGKAVTYNKGMPQVDGEGPFTIKVPEAGPPDKLLVSQLLSGEGSPIKQGQSVAVKYSGWTWRGGDPFDSNWPKDIPDEFVIGTGNVIKAWDVALVGQKVGSRVVIVAPPSDAYGDKPPAESSIKPGDTLIFVVDILGTYDVIEPTAMPSDTASEGETP